MNPGHFRSYCKPNTLEDLIVGKKKKKKKLSTKSNKDISPKQKSQGITSKVINRGRTNC